MLNEFIAKTVANFARCFMLDAYPKLEVRTKTMVHSGGFTVDLIIENAQHTLLLSYLGVIYNSNGKTILTLITNGQQSMQFEPIVGPMDVALVTSSFQTAIRYDLEFRFAREDWWADRAVPNIKKLVDNIIPFVPTKHGQPQESSYGIDAPIFNS